jgi:hypothetical protein
MGPRILARQLLNENYKQIMSAFSSIYTQLEFGENGTSPKLNQIAAYYTVVFFKAKTIPPIVSHIDLHMTNNPDLHLDEEDQNLAAEILVENHIHELKVDGLINVRTLENGLHEITLTEKGLSKSKAFKKDIRLL